MVATQHLYSMNNVMMELNLIPSETGKDILIKEMLAPEDHLKIQLLPSIDDFIKKNPSTKQISSPIFFTRPGQPDPDGLLSNEIFGLTKDERSGIWGYIDLIDNFIHPLVYKKLIRSDRRFRDIIHGNKYYIIDNGELIENENGNTGIVWLKKHFKEIKLKATGSDKRDNVIKFIKLNEDRMFMNKFLVLPAYYRDVNTQGEGKVSVGEINQLYSSLIIATRSIQETEEFGLNVADSVRGRIQEIILAIYDWFCGNNNDALEGATGLSKKMGLIKRAGQSKTADYGSRLVLSAPELKVEKVDDIMVDIQHSGIPLASVCANYAPYMIFYVKRFFENEFAPGTTIDIIRKNGAVEQHKVTDPMIVFSEDRIVEELERYIHGYANRFIPIEIPIEGIKGSVYLKFKGRYTDLDQKVTDEEPGQSSLINRRMTWCDLFYMAACEATFDKTVLITRYPIDSMYNQFPTKIVVTSTKETEPVEFNGKFYKYYPIIREEDIGSNTSNRFIDTLWLSNLMLKAIGGDYDGDTASVKGVYTKEANQELMDYMDSKLNYIGFDGSVIRTTTNEAIQSIFNLTRVLNPNDLDEMKF